MSLEEIKELYWQLNRALIGCEPSTELIDKFETKRAHELKTFRQEPRSAFGTSDLMMASNMELVISYSSCGFVSDAIN
jgi:hypothetical protein